jgi:hypothetical protein
MTDLSFLDDDSFLDHQREYDKIFHLQAMWRHAIRSYSSDVKRCSESILRYIRLINTSPPVEEGADEYMAEAETALAECLFAVKIARLEHANRLNTAKLAAE